MNSPDDRLHRLLGAPETAWILERARARLARGLPLTGFITRSGATEAERVAVGRLLGRAVASGRSVSLSLERLDEVVRRSGACPAGLAAAVVTLTGPVEDPSIRQAEQEAWAAVGRSLTDLSADRPELTPWVESLRARGQLRRVTTGADDARSLVAQLRTVVADLPADGESIARFAARTLGRAHALDAGTPLGGLAVAAAAVLGQAAGGPGNLARPGSASWRRDAWAAVGVIVDDLSSTVLVLGLPGSVSMTGTAGALAQLAAQGQPAVLTLRQVIADDVGAVPATVFACENPAVVSAAADRLGSASPPLLCLQGQPSAAAIALVRHLRSCGAVLRYHGDFDWGGVTIARTLASYVEWLPWRYDADAYLEAVEGRADSLPTLSGVPQATPWDARLGEAMQQRGVSVEEEVVIDHLLGDLAEEA